MKSTLGQQELSLLRFVAGAQPVSAGEVFAQFGTDSGLARSTVETMLDRLHRKGHLKRSKVEGVFRYRTSVPAEEMLKGLVEQFVERSLGGSLTPLVTYFAERGKLTPQEVAELERIVERMGVERTGREEKP